MRGRIETIAFGGQGILRDDGFVVFVPFTAPGDRVEVELISKKKRHGIAKLAELIQPSPLRVEPRCTHFGTCGGCQFQHIAYPAQLEIKRKFIEDALQRIALAPISVTPIISAPEPWSYRQHVRLNIRSELCGIEAGYIGQDHNTFVPVRECPIFCDTSTHTFRDLQAFVSQLGLKQGQTAHIRLFKQQNNYLLLFIFPELIPKEASELADKALQTCPSWQGIILAAPDQTLYKGVTNCFLDILGLKLQFSPFGFIQNHPEQSIKLYQYILDQVPENSKQVLDLYCGIGTTALLLAKKGIKTTGIESHLETVQLARSNAQTNGISNATFHCGKAETLISSTLATTQYDTVLLNPPRTGLDRKVVAQLIKASPDCLIYTSCMPTTLARDIGELIKSGYQIQSVQGFDMFPQTTHVETVVVLTVS